MKYSESLKKNKDFQNIYKKGISCANKYLVMYQMENGKSRNRIGISVSKKVGLRDLSGKATDLMRKASDVVMILL